MSKSRYSKTKAAGEAVGMNRYGKQFNQSSRLVPSKTDRCGEWKAEGGNQVDEVRFVVPGEPTGKGRPQTKVMYNPNGFKDKKPGKSVTPW